MRKASWTNLMEGCGMVVRLDKLLMVFGGIGGGDRELIR